MIRLLVRLLFAVVFFVLGSAITLAIMWGVYTTSGAPVRPSPWWLIGPVMTALAGLRYGGQFDIEGLIAGMGRRQRLFVGFSGLWALICVVVFSVFDPMGKYRWGVTEWIKFLIIMAGPIAVGFLASRVSRWAAAGDQS